jgi:hypothetical protein
MRNPFRNPLIKSIIHYLILQALAFFYANYIKLPALKFLAPNYDNGKCLICIKSKSEYFESVRINIEFYDKFICEANAYKIDTSKNKKEFKTSRHDNDFIAWDYYLDGKEICLYATEEIRIILTYASDMPKVPIKNISFIHNKGFISLEDYKSKLQLRRFIWVFCILILFFTFPYAIILASLQRRFLRKCYHENNKALTKFNTRFHGIIYKEVDKYGRNLHESDKEDFFLVIVTQRILPHWKVLPKFYKGLDITIQKTSRSFFIDYLNYSVKEFLKK